MSELLKVQIDKSDVAKVYTMLGVLSKAANKVTLQAVNRTLTGVRTDITNEVSKVITPTKKKIRSSVHVHKYSSALKTAYVTCRGEPLNLSHFKARQTQKGVTVQVKKAEGRSLLKHAYFITTKKGEKIVVWRAYEGKRSKWRKNFPYGKLPQRNFWSSGNLNYRGPIEWLYSFAIPDVLKHSSTMQEVLRLAGVRLKKNINDRLNYELSKAK